MLNINFLFAVMEPIVLGTALTHIVTETPGQIIRFNTVLIDTAGVYDQNVGIVTIPQTGVYEVNVNLFKDFPIAFNNAIADLYVNDTGTD